MAALLSIEVLGAVTAAFILGYGVSEASKGEEGTDEVERYLQQRREQLQERYETTSMDYVEFGDRIALLEKPGTERIVRDTTDVDRIGPKTGLEIARMFDGDYNAYRNADQDSYEEVNGVGENIGSALAARNG